MIHKGAIALGVLLGATLGVMFAPEKGPVTRKKVKDEAKNIKDQFTEDAKEVKEDLVKAAKSGKEAFEKKTENFASKASHKTEDVISFLEKQLAILKEKNRKLQKTT